MEPGRAWPAGCSAHRSLARWRSPVAARPPHSAVQVALVLAGALDVSALRDALSALVVHHQLLRAGPSAQFTLPLLDLSAEQRNIATADEVIATVLAEESLISFDPGVLAPFRCWLVRLNQTDHILSLVLDKAAGEQASAEQLFSELPARYAAAREGRSADLVTNSPPCPARPPRQATTTEFEIPAETWSGMRASATLIGVTAPTLLIAALASLLGRRARSDHVVVTIPAAAREQHAAIGLDVSRDATETEVIEQLRAELAAAGRCGGVDDGAPLAAVESGGQPGRPLEFELTFDGFCEKDALYGAGQWEPGLRATVAHADPARVRLDLTLLVNAGDRAGVSLHYPADLLSRAAMRGIARDLRTMLGAIASDAAVGHALQAARAARSESASL